MFVLVLLLVGCATLADPSPVPDYPSRSDAWSDGLILAEAAHLDAPAIGLAADGWAVVWADGPTVSFRQIASGGTPGSIQVLNLGARTPWNLSLWPAPEDGWHLLWQDLDSLGQTRLFSARLNDDGALVRGPILLTPDPVSAAAVAPGEGGTVVLIWADTGPRPTLYGQIIDTQGRLQGGPPNFVAADAGWPILGRTADRLWVLAWLSASGGGQSTFAGQRATVNITDGVFPWEGQAETFTLGTVSRNSVTEYVETVRLGLDQTRGYLFVSHRDAATQSPHTEAFSFSLVYSDSNSDDARRIQRQEILLPADSDGLSAPVSTGFNTGPALALPTNGERGRVGLATPVWGQFNVLPVAFELNGDVVVGYFQAGQLLGYQPISSGGRIGGTISFWADREHHLSLAWANLPLAKSDPATLLLSSTQPLLRDAESATP